MNLKLFNKPQSNGKAHGILGLLAEQRCISVSVLAGLFSLFSLSSVLNNKGAEMERHLLFDNKSKISVAALKNNCKKTKQRKWFVSNIQLKVSCVSGISRHFLREDSNELTSLAVVSNLYTSQQELWHSGTHPTAVCVCVCM